MNEDDERTVGPLYPVEMAHGGFYWTYDPLFARP
jgi:hypothetical protein